MRDTIERSDSDIAIHTLDGGEKKIIKYFLESRQLFFLCESLNEPRYRYLQGHKVGRRTWKDGVQT